MRQGDADEESPTETSDEVAGHGHDSVDGIIAEFLKKSKMQAAMWCTE